MNQSISGHDLLGGGLCLQHVKRTVPRLSEQGEEYDEHVHVFGVRLLWLLSLSLTYSTVTADKLDLDLGLGPFGLNLGLTVRRTLIP